MACEDAAKRSAGEMLRTSGGNVPTDLSILKEEALKIFYLSTDSWLSCRHWYSNSRQWKFESRDISSGKRPQEGVERGQEISGKGLRVERGREWKEASFHSSPGYLIGLERSRE